MGSKNLEKSSGDTGPIIMGKQPIRKLQFAIHRITKVVHLHLDLLKKQRSNIEKLKESEDWTKLHSEIINASRTVQQLKADMYELEIVRHQIADEDVEEFEEDSKKIQTAILKEVSSFIEIHHDALQPAPPMFTQSSLHKIKEDIMEEEHFLNVSSNNYPSMDSEGLQLFQERNLTMSLDAGIQQNNKTNSVYQTWTHLNQELLDLNTVIKGFASIVLGNKETLNTLESNIDTTHQNVTEGTEQLSKAAKLKLAVVPVTAAVVGGLVGGPLGLLAGFKAAGVIGAVGGSIIGFTGFRIFNKRRLQYMNKTDIELSELKRK